MLQNYGTANLGVGRGGWKYWSHNSCTPDSTACLTIEGLSLSDSRGGQSDASSERRCPPARRTQLAMHAGWTGRGGRGGRSRSWTLVRLPPQNTTAMIRCFRSLLGTQAKGPCASDIQAQGAMDQSRPDRRRRHESRERCEDKRRGRGFGVMFALPQDLQRVLSRGGVKKMSSSAEHSTDMALTSVKCNVGSWQKPRYNLLNAYGNMY